MIRFSDCYSGIYNNWGKEIRIIFAGSDFTYDIFSLQIGCFFTSVTNKTQYSRVISSQREFIRMFDFNILTLFFQNVSEIIFFSSGVLKPSILQAGQKCSVARHRKKTNREAYMGIREA